MKIEENTITVSAESVDAYRKLLNDPKAYNLPFRPIVECFKQADIATAKHILFEQFLQEVPALNKIFFYIIMDELYKEFIDKDEKGLLGYRLQFLTNTESKK